MTAIPLPQGGGTRRKLGWQGVVLAISAIVMAALILCLVQTYTTTPSPKRWHIACIDDHPNNCSPLNLFLQRLSGDQIQIDMYPECNPLIVQTIVDTGVQLVTVDGDLGGSEWWGVDCVKGIVAARGASPVPIIVAYSLNDKLRGNQAQFSDLNIDPKSDLVARAQQIMGILTSLP